MRGRAERMTWCCFSRMPRMPNRCGTFSWRSTDLAVAGRRAVRPRPAAAGGRCSGPSNRPALHCFRALQHERRQRGVPVPWRVRVVAQADQRRLRAAETALPFVGDHEPGVAEDPCRDDRERRGVLRSGAPSWRRLSGYSQDLRRKISGDLLMALIGEEGDNPSRLRHRVDGLRP